MKKRVVWMLICLAVCILCATLTVAAQDVAEPILTLNGRTLSLENNVCIKYVVTAQNVEKSEVKMLIWTTPQTEYVYGTQSSVLSASTDPDYPGKCVFVYDRLPAKAMTETVYSCIYAKVNGVEYYAGLNKYSVLQYAYNLRNQTSVQPLLSAMLKYGAEAQRFFQYRTDDLADAVHYQISVSGGCLEDGFTRGLYVKDGTVTVCADPAPVDEAFLGWVDTAGKIVSTSPTATFSVTGDASYAARFSGDTYEYALSDDGTFYTITGQNEPAGNTVIIPASHRGLPVRAIANSVFAGRTDIAYVFYRGNAAEWANLSIGTGNEVIVKAGRYYYSETEPLSNGKFWHYADGKAQKWVWASDRDPLTLTKENCTPKLPAAFEEPDVTIHCITDGSHVGYTGLGVHDLSESYSNGSTRWHCYLEVSDSAIKKMKFADGSQVENSDLYVRFTFEVPVTGWYDVCFNFRLKDLSLRDGVFQLDNQPVRDQLRLIVNVGGGTLSSLRNEESDTYVTGLSLKLTKGTHTLTVRKSEGGSLHFRNIYMKRQVPIISDFYVQNDFSTTLPSQFTGDDVIRIPASSCEVGCDRIETVKAGSQYRLYSVSEDRLTGANGVTKLASSGVFHYYTDLSNFTVNGVAPQRYDLFMKWSFDVPSDGYYDFCFNLRIKDNAMRYTQLSLDDEPVSRAHLLGYELEDCTLIRDSLENAYVGNWRVYLTAGTHSLTARMPEKNANTAYSGNMSSAWHFRNIYIAPSVEKPDNREQIPVLAGSELYDGNMNESRTWAAEKAGYDAYKTYAKQLTNAGFVLRNERVTSFRYMNFDSNGIYTSKQNTEYQNIYRVYTSARSVVYLNYSGGDQDIRVICADISEYNVREQTKAHEDALRKQSEGAVTQTDTVFAMLDIGRNESDPSKSDGNGMCFVFKLNDGRFLVIDGGQWGNDSASQNARVTKLYNWLLAHSENGNIDIACWMFTHNHSDHINVAWKFEQMYGSKSNVTIERYMYSFPDMIDYIPTHTPVHNVKIPYYTVRYPRMKQMLSRYDALIARTGATYRFANAEVEVMYSNDDFFPQPFRIFNNSSTVFKITIEGKSFLFGGDLQEAGQDDIVIKQGDLLDVDYVQMTHHGYNGRAKYFQYAYGTDGAIGLWPLPKETSMEGLRTLNKTDSRTNAWFLDHIKEIYFAFNGNYEKTLNSRQSMTFSTENFTPVLPSRFTGDGVLTLDAGVLENGSDLTQNTTNRNQYFLLAKNGVGATESSANGVVKLLVKGDYHYYLSASENFFKNKGLNPSDAYMQWAFDVPESGWYDVCLYMRVKSADDRKALISFNGATPLQAAYNLAGKDITGLRNESEGSYLTGMRVYLHTGTNVIKVTSAGTASWHFRDFYFVKAS